jgi:hypothetical protein
MTAHPLDIPDFLRIPPEERRAVWKGRRLTRQGSGFQPQTKIEEPATRALRRQIEAEARARAKAKVIAQREKRRAAKRSRIKRRKGP